MGNYQDVGTVAACIPDCRTDRQYFSDGNVHTGADVVFCAEASVHFPVINDFWLLDAQ